jgi:RHS repeat-associated protein
MAEQRSYTGSFTNRWKFTGKELDEETGLYYYGARFYNPVTSLWLSVDPLAEKYPSMSPYIYCANNPIIYIDPDGREIIGKESLENAAKFKDETNKKIADLRIEKMKEQNSNKPSKKNIKEIDDKISQFKGALNELSVLEKSDQKYSINTSSKNVQADAKGNITYDVADNVLNVNITDAWNVENLAHELKHAYQFEIGAMSLDGDGRSGGSLYDMQDEVEAFERGTLYGSTQKLSDGGYSKLRNRREQSTLNTIMNKCETCTTTFGDFLKAKNSDMAKQGIAPSEFYRNWKNDYKK